MESNSKNVNQNSADVEDSEQILGTKVQNEQLKTLMESNNDIQKSLHDLKNLVMSQNQNQDKSQNFQGIGTTKNYDHVEETNFEQHQKRIKLDDQSEEIQRLNQVINDLKEDNSKLSNMNAKLLTENDHLQKVQKQNEVAMKDLKKGKDNQIEENKLLQRVLENSEDLIRLLEVNETMNSKLEEDNLRLSKENTKLSKQNQEMKKQKVANDQAKKDLKKYNSELSKKNAMLYKNIDNFETKFKDLERRFKVVCGLETNNGSS